MNRVFNLQYGQIRKLPSPSLNLSDLWSLARTGFSVTGMSNLAARKGDILYCLNQHRMGEVLRDIEIGEMNWGDAFKLDDYPNLKAGEPQPLCKTCGATPDYLGTRPAGQE